MLRELYLKCKTLLKLKEYSSKKNIDKILKENEKLNKILDKKCNNIKEETENKIEESLETENKIEENKSEIFSPRNNIDKPEDKPIDKSEDKSIDKSEEKSEEKPEDKMVTIELREENDIIVEIENIEDELKEVEEQNKANDKCVNGCNICMNGCDLICTGVGYICQCFNYYMGRLYRKIKKCFD
jgi:hypothetical protein